jgi:hypothetical protein
MKIAACLPGLLLATLVRAETILLVDDHDVLYRSGTQRVLTLPTRHPANPLIKRDRPWEVQIAWNSVHRDEKTGKWQLWYQAWNTLPPSRGESCVVCYAESDDGIAWTKPALDLFPFNNEKQSNIVLLGNGGHSYRYANSVLVDPRDPDPSRRYKMAYFDWAKDEGVEYPGLCVAFSPDGIHWTKHPKAPLSRVNYGNFEDPLPMSDQLATRPWAAPMSMADAVDVMFDPRRNVFAWYGKMWLDSPRGTMAWKHAMGRCESADFIHWSKPQLVAAPDDRDPPTMEFHTSPVFFHGGVYFCLNQLLDRGAGGGVIDIELMTSRDGIKWERNFRDQRWLTRSAQPKQFDSGSIFTNSTPAVVGDAMRFYYGAYGGGATGEDEINGVSGIGLVTLPRDRFAGVKPVAKSDQPTLKKPLEHVGQITFRARDFTKTRGIRINADASSGSIRGEILNDAGRLVRGFTKDDAIAVTGDSFAHPLRWTSRTLDQLPAGAGQYHLRLHIERATVYALDLD